MESVFWADAGPPSAPRESVPVFSCPAVGTHYVRFLGPPVGVWLHWAGNKHVPCLGGACKLCPGVPQRWKAFGPAVRWQIAPAGEGQQGGCWVRVVAELTEEAYLGLPEVLAWRGLVVELRREQGRAASRLLANVSSGKLASDAPLPETFDVRPILERLWGLRPRVTVSKRPGKGPGPTNTADQTAQVAEIPATIPFPAKSSQGGA